jgi:hypothetical protein
MTDIPVDDDLEDVDGTEEVEPDPPPRKRRGRRSGSDVAVEREVTKRHMIEAISSIVVVVLYMLFTLLRERDQGFVAIDPEDGDGPEDDWQG